MRKAHNIDRAVHADGPEPSGRQAEAHDFAGNGMDNVFGQHDSFGMGGSQGRQDARQNGWHNYNRQMSDSQPEKGPIRMTDQQRRLHAKGRYTPY